MASVLVALGFDAVNIHGASDASKFGVGTSEKFQGINWLFTIKNTMKWSAVRWLHCILPMCTWMFAVVEFRLGESQFMGPSKGFGRQATWSENVATDH